jgi:hypothetical protein
VCESKLVFVRLAHNRRFVGWRRVKVTDRHTAVDYAHILKELARYPPPSRSDNRSGPG